MYYRTDNSEQDKRLRASSQPPSASRNAVPSSTTRTSTLPYSTTKESSPGKNIYSNNDFNVDKKGVQYSVYNEEPKPVVASPHRPRSSAAHRERDHIPFQRRSTDLEVPTGYDYIYGGETGTPAASLDRHASVSTRVSASRSQTLPGHRRELTSAQAVQRSQTLPAEALYPREKPTRSPAPMRTSERYDAQIEQDDDDDDDDYIYPSMHRSEATSSKKGDKGSERIQRWLEETKEAGAKDVIGRDEPQTRRIAHESERMFSDSASRSKRIEQEHSSGRGRAHYPSIPPVSITTDPVYEGNGMLTVSEEPEDIGTRGLIREDDLLSSDSESQGKGRTFDKRNYTPYPTQRDSLRVEDGVGAQAVHLPSPRSLHKSSRTSSTRNSYEQDYFEQEREPDRPRRTKSKSPRSKGQVASLSSGPGQLYGISTASAAANEYQQTYTTPPITPTRAEESRSPSYVPSMTHERSPNYQAPARLAYMYRSNGATPSPHARSSSSVTPASVSRSISTKHQSQSQYSHGEHISSSGTRKQSPRASRSPSPRVPGHTSTSSNYYANLAAQASTPARSHTHTQSQPFAYGDPVGRTHGYSSNAHAQAQAHEGRQITRSASRAATGTGVSTASAAAAAAALNSRHVRSGYWNRRGDHLTSTGYVVLCPPERSYPRDLADYPDTEFRDHFGNTAKGTPDRYPQLPESISKMPGRPAERKYESVCVFSLPNCFILFLERTQTDEFLMFIYILVH